MSDKLRKTFPIKITFANGEQPSGAKLNAGFNQARNALGIVEKAVGDVWNQSGDPDLNSFPLQIPNLARYTGENKYLNPAITHFTNDFLYREDLGSRYPNKNTGYLTFKPTSGSSFTAVGGGNPLTNLVGSKALVLNPGDWYVNPTTGEVTSYSPLVATDSRIEYEVDVSEIATTDQVLPGIIPDPRQTEFTSVRVSGSGPFYIHLPPRRPFGFGATDGGLNDQFARPNQYPQTSEIGINPVTSPTTTNEAVDLPGGSGAGSTGYLYWQSDTVNALADIHYRYGLPKEVLTGFTPGEQYPQGYFYLFDKTENTIIEDVVFKRGSGAFDEDWILEVESGTFDFSALATGDESETSYNSSNLILITTGAPLARSVWHLASMFFNHKHNPTSLDTRVEHGALTGLNPASDNNFPIDVPGVWPESNWNDDDHAYLLSRAGSWPEASGVERDLYNNAMLGNLLIGKDYDYSSGSTPNTVSGVDTHKIKFGSNDYEAAIWGQSSSEQEGKVIKAKGALEFTDFYEDISFASSPQQPVVDSIIPTGSFPGAQFSAGEVVEIWMAYTQIDNEGNYRFGPFVFGGDATIVENNTLINVEHNIFSGSQLNSNYTTADNFTVVFRVDKGDWRAVQADPDLNGSTFLFTPSDGTNVEQYIPELDMPILSNLVANTGKEGYLAKLSANYNENLIENLRAAGRFTVSGYMRALGKSRFDQDVVMQDVVMQDATLVNITISSLGEPNTDDNVDLGTNLKAFRTIYGNSLLPGADLTGNIGSASLRYNDGYFNDIEVSNSLLPDTHAGASIGSSSLPFNEIHSDEFTADPFIGFNYKSPKTFRLWISPHLISTLSLNGSFQTDGSFEVTGGISSTSRVWFPITGLPHNCSIDRIEIQCEGSSSHSLDVALVQIIPYGSLSTITSGTITVPSGFAIGDTIVFDTGLPHTVDYSSVTGFEKLTYSFAFGGSTNLLNANDAFFGIQVFCSYDRTGLLSTS